MIFRSLGLQFLHSRKHYKNSVFIFAQPVRWVRSCAFMAPFFSLWDVSVCVCVFKESTAKQVFWGGLTGFAAELLVTIGFLTVLLSFGNDW